MGLHKSKVRIELKTEDLKQLTHETYFSEKEIKVMYKRYWTYCSPDATLNKEQFCSMFNGGTDKGKAIVDHIFRAIDRDGSFSLGESFLIFISQFSLDLRAEPFLISQNEFLDITIFLFSTN